MRAWLSCRRLAQTATLRCPNTGLRCYSFTADIQRFFDSYDSNVNSSIPPIVPATRQRLAAFHRDVKDRRIATKNLTRDYNYLHRNSNIRALPRDTASAYLARLLKDADVKTATKVLLDYELGEAVLVAKDALKSMQFFEREASLFTLWHGFRQISQEGLAYQILMETGLTPGQLEAIKRLTIVQNRVAHALEDDLEEIVQMSIRLAIRMRPQHAFRDCLDPSTAHLLVRRALELDFHDLALRLCRQNLHATDALKLYFAHQAKEDAIMKVALDDLLRHGDGGHIDSKNELGASEDIWIWLINRVIKSSNLERLAQNAPKTPKVQYALALRASTTPKTLEMSIAVARSLSQDDLPTLLYHWTLHAKSASLPKDDIFDLLQSLSEPLILQTFSRYLDVIHNITAGHLHNYDIACLMYVLELMDGLPISFSTELQESISKNFVNRPANELVRYAGLKKTSLESIESLTRHSLARFVPGQKTEPANLPIVKGDKFALVDAGEALPLDKLHPLAKSNPYADIFVSLVSKPVDARPNLEDLKPFHEEILRSLLGLPSSDMAMQFVIQSRHVGFPTDNHIAPKLIRKILRDGRDLWLILFLYMETPEVDLSHAIWSRCISESALEHPVLAMQALQVMIRRGFTPHRRLIHETMMAVSESASISDHAAFRYLQDCYHVSRSCLHERDTIHLASFLNVVLTRRGLAVDHHRLAWLLRLSEQILGDDAAAPVTQQELVELIGRWSQYVKTHGTRSEARPKRLREIIDGLILHAAVPRPDQAQEIADPQRERGSATAGTSLREVSRPRSNQAHHGPQRQDFG